MKKPLTSVIVTVSGLALVCACESAVETPASSHGQPDGGEPAPIDAESDGAREASAPEAGETCSLTLLGTAPGQLSLGEPACNACLTTNCCEAFHACVPPEGGNAAQMECFRLLACIEGCLHPASPPEDGGGGPDACIGACQASFPAGGPLLSAVLACAGARCADAGSDSCPKL